MKVNSISTTANYDNKQLKNNSKANTNFKGLADLPGIIMQGIENGGFATSFIVQDTIGMTLPRTWEGLNRGVEKKEDDQPKGNFIQRTKNFFKNFNLKAMNLKEGAEVFLREGLSGPFLMFAPMLVLFGAKKFVGKSTFTNSSLINRLGNTLTDIVKNGSHSSTNAIKSAFYKDSIAKAVGATTSAADKVAEAGFVNKVLKEIETLDTYTARAGKSKLRQKAVKRQQAKIVEMFNDFHTTNNADYSMVNKLKFEGQTYSTSSFVDGLRGYAHDALKNKQVTDITESYTKNLKNNSLIKRGITNIAAGLSAIGAVSIVPKLYSLINPVPPGALPNVGTQAATQDKSTQAPQTPANTQKPNNNGNKVSFKGKWDSLARNLEFNGNNFTPALMTVSALGGLLGPRIKTAIKRAPEDPVTKKKDYSEVPEVLTRDVISTVAVTFGVPVLSKALISSYEHGSGFVLQSHPKEQLTGVKKVLDAINPFSAFKPLDLKELNSVYGGVNTPEKLSTFTRYIDNNNGSLAKIFKSAKNSKAIFAEHGLNLAELAKQSDRKSANQTIMNLAESSKEFAEKLVNLLKPEKGGKANKIVKKARSLNSITTGTATLIAIPAFLGVILPKIVYAQTARRQKQKSLAAAGAEALNNPNQQVAMKGADINYSVLKKENINTFDKMKHQ